VPYLSVQQIGFKSR